MAVLALVLLVLLAAVPEAAAQRLALRTWSSADGLAGDQITALLPDSRGFLWIGTTTGLSRFDGREFRNYGVADGLPHPSINALLEDRDGVLWIATSGGLVRVEPQAQAMSRVRLGDNPAASVLHVIQTRDGRIWAATRHDLYSFGDERHRGPPTRVPIALPTAPPPALGHTWLIEALVEGRDGDLWIGTTWGLLRRLADGRMVPIRVRPTAQDDRIYNLAVDRDGRLWITHWGIAHRPGVHFGVYVLAPEPPGAAAAADRATLHARARRVATVDRLTLPTRPGDAIYMTAGGPMGSARVHSVQPLEDGTIWVATEDGLVRIEGERTIRYHEPNGLGVPIRFIARDRDANLWLGTRGLGLVRLEVDGFVTYAAPEGFPNGAVGAIVEDQTGTLCLTGTEANGRQWFGTLEHDRLVRFAPRGTERIQYWGWGWRQLFLQDRSGAWWLPTGEGLFRYPASPSCRSMASTPPTAVYGRKQGLPIDEIFRLFEDSRGDLWMSVGPSPVRWVRATGTFEVVTERENAPTTFAEDRAGNVWMGFYRGGLARWRAGRLQFFEASDGVPGGFITDLFLDAEGRLWIGADSGGLARIDDPTAIAPRIVRPSKDDVLTETAVYNVIADRAQHVYVSTARGILRFDPTLAYARRFSTSDGLVGHEIHTAHADRQGRLWFGAQRGLSRLTPRLEPMPTPPPIFVDSLRVDGVPQGVSQLGLVTVPELRIDADSRRVEIGYGSPSLAPGDTPRYQVRLRGVDPDWGPATNDRTALYLNLAPGHYRFEARAVASHGLASPRPASVAFTILPPIWQRWWFQLAAGAMVAAAAYSVYRARLSRLLALERVRARLATDLHDDLGARLSRISILAEVAARRVSSDARSAGRLLGEVGETARSLIEAADDITWSVDPRQDDLASLVARIRRFVGELLEARDIAWTFEAPVTGARIKLSPERRRHVLLVFQEASNNVVRHAGARHVVMSLRLDGHQLHAEIQDDGCGFEVAADTDADAAGVRPVSPHAGRGLSNMRARARELGGLLTITSAVGRGTSVRLTAPVR